MAQSEKALAEKQSLDRVIRTVSGKSEPYEKSYQTMVPVVEDETARIFRRYKYYLVSHDGTSGTEFVRTGLRFQARKADSLLEVKINYRVSASRENAEKVAKSLHNSGSLQEQLDRFFLKWARDFVKSHGGDARFIERFFPIKSELEKYLNDQAWADTGLQCHTTVSLVSADLPDPLVVERVLAAATASNYRAEPVKITITRPEFYLHADPLVAIQAHLTYETQRDLDKVVVAAVKRYVEGRQLESMRIVTDRLRDELTQEINEALSPFGRYLKRLDHVEFVLPVMDAPAHHRFEHRFEHYVPQYGNINVAVKGSMKLEDWARFAVTKVDLKLWPKQALEDGTTTILANMRFADLFDCLDKKRDAIYTDFVGRCDAIGYRLVEFDFNTDLPFERIKRPFTVSGHEEFPTRQPKVKVVIEFDATLRIPDATKIAEELGGGWFAAAESPERRTAETRIREQIVAEIKSRIREADPDLVYLHWGAPRPLPGTNKELPSLEDEIREGIASMLRETYGAEVLSVHCQRDGKLIQLFEQLQGSSPPFDVMVTPANHRVVVKYNVVGVDAENWYTFQTVQPDARKLEAAVRDIVRQMLSDVPLAEFLQRPNQYWGKLINSPDKGNLTQKILKRFGVKLAIDYWVRDLTTQETIDADLANKNLAARQQIHTKGIEASVTRFDEQLELKSLNRREKLEEREMLQTRKRGLNPTDPADAEKLREIQKMIKDIDDSLSTTESDEIEKLVLDSLKQGHEGVRRQLAPAAEPRNTLLLGGGTTANPDDDMFGSWTDADAEDLPKDDASKPD